ncbi:hypothetical protein [Nitrosovibrio sp. Nv4]|nr:hypothetical protein [Nitrosovibrio sp. Nv4]
MFAPGKMLNAYLERPYRRGGYVALYGLDNAHTHHSQEYQLPDI